MLLFNLICVRNRTSTKTNIRKFSICGCNFPYEQIIELVKFTCMFFFLFLFSFFLSTIYMYVCCTIVCYFILPVSFPYYEHRSLISYIHFFYILTILLFSLFYLWPHLTRGSHFHSNTFACYGLVTASTICHRLFYRWENGIVRGWDIDRVVNTIFTFHVIQWRVFSSLYFRIFAFLLFFILFIQTVDSVALFGIDGSSGDVTQLNFSCYTFCLACLNWKMDAVRTHRRHKRDTTVNKHTKFYMSLTFAVFFFFFFSFCIIIFKLQSFSSLELELELVVVTFCSVSCRSPCCLNDIIFIKYKVTNMKWIMCTTHSEMFRETTIPKGISKLCIFNGILMIVCSQQITLNCLFSSVCCFFKFFFAVHIVFRISFFSWCGQVLVPWGEPKTFTWSKNDTGKLEEKWMNKGNSKKKNWNEERNMEVCSNVVTVWWRRLLAT